MSGRLGAGAVAIACVATLAVGLGVVVSGFAGGGPPGSPTPHRTTSAGSPRTTQAASPKVAPLDRVVAPDLLVIAKHEIDSAKAAKVRRLKDVDETARMAAGDVQVGPKKKASLLGVDPSTFRAWTPLASAKSDALWRALAYDQLVLTFESAKAGEVRLGDTYPVTAAREMKLRLGGVAELQLPKVDGLVTTSTARGLGMKDGAAMLVNAPAADIGTLTAKVRKIVGDGAEVVPMREPPPQTGGGGSGGGGSISDARSYAQLYQAAARRCPGLSWTVLAGIGQVESGHGRNTGPSSAGALGPMQFLPSTWKSYGADGNGDGKRDIHDPYDAIPAAADYLCASGAGKGGQSLYRAIFAYNHSDEYVRKVLATAAAYAEGS